MKTLTNTLSYRPRNAGHDYYGRGTYLITLVVSGRERLLSQFVTDAGHKAPLVLTPLGEAVQDARLHIIPGAGHGFKPKEFQEEAEQLERFLK